MSIEVIINELYLCPTHAYFGRHGLSSLDGEMMWCDELACHAGRGVVGDRFYDYKPEYKGQITFFNLAVHTTVMAATGLDKPASIYRRNVIINGVDVTSLIGVIFKIGEVMFEGVEHCKPCYWMDEACAPGAELLLTKNGGLRAKILRSGELKTGSYLLEICTAHDL